MILQNWLIIFTMVKGALFHQLFNKFRIKIYKTINIASCAAIWLWNMVSYIKGEMQAKSIWEQDPQVNIWAQEGWEWGVEKAPQRGTS